MKSIESLSKDHDEVLELLNKFYGAINKIENGEEIDREGLENILQFFNSDFWLHFDKEEQTVFPELSKYIGGSTEPAGPVIAMLDEHQILRESNKKMQSNYKNFAVNSKNFTSEARNFIGLLRQHIKMEEEMLFPMVISSLDHSLDGKWLKAFGIIEKNAKTS